MIDNDRRIVITGIGLTAPNGNSLSELRSNLINLVSGVTNFETRHMDQILAGVCDFDALRYQKKKEVRLGTRAGSISIYCAHEAIKDSGVDFANYDRSRIGVYVGTTEHGNVETENEVYNVSQFNYDTKYWTHHHNPRTVANNPAGEVTINMGITGPHYCIGAACAAGNAGIIQGAQMLLLDEIDMAVCGGVSESIHTFGIFASFRSQGALAWNEDPTKASRPFDINRNGIVVSEGGCLFTLEKLSSALKRNAHIYGELVGYSINSDANNNVKPLPERQVQLMNQVLKRAKLNPQDVDIINTHATSTKEGDICETSAIRQVFTNCPNTYINNTKSYIGHCMGAAGAIELAGNLPSFNDNIIHPTINLDEIDPECELKNIVANKPIEKKNIKHILNLSFGMLGINSAVLIKKFER